MSRARARAVPSGFGVGARVKSKSAARKRKGRLEYLNDPETRRIMKEFEYFESKRANVKDALRAYVIFFNFKLSNIAGMPFS